MADTRIDTTLHDGDPPEPAPITERDPELQPPPAPSPAPAGRRLAVAAAALAAVALVAAVAVYLFVVRYEARARRHVPGNANLVVRADVADLALFPPVRDRIVPLYMTRAPGDRSRLDRIRATTGVSFGTDLREIVVASTDTKSWVVLLGGRIARGRFVRGLAKVTRDEGWLGFIEKGDLLLAPNGVVIAQADDGTIIVGTDEAIVAAAIPATDDHRRLDLPEGAVSCAIAREAFRGAAGAVGLDHGSALGKIDHASGRMTLGSEPALTMTLEPAPGVPAADLAQELDALLVEARAAEQLLPDVAGEKGALTAATITVHGEEIVLAAPWPYEGLDHGVARIAGMMGGTPTD